MATAPRQDRVSVARMWWLAVLRTVGGAIVVATLVDIATTAVSVGLGRGPVTHYVSRRVWLAFSWARRRLNDNRMLAAAGPVVLAVTIATWTLGLVIGWALVFAGPESIVSTGDGQRVAAIGRVYYAAATVIGRGSALYQPSTNTWQVMEQLAGASGVVLLGLAIAYTLAVVNAVVHTRRIAAQISTLGFSAEDVLSRSWDGETFGNLHLHLVALVTEISFIARLHLAFPLLFYFRSSDRRSAIGPNVAVLDETLTAIECCVDGAEPPPATVAPLRAAIDDFLDSLYKGFVGPAADTPQAPSLSGLAELGAIAEDGVDATFERQTQRRRLLSALVEHDGWTWADVEGRGHDRGPAVERA